MSNRLLWNEKGLIVITNTSDLNSYIVPEPGVRVSLADITDTLPVWTLMLDINERGDILGVGGQTAFNAEHSFVLKRVHGAPYSVSETEASSPQ